MDIVTLAAARKSGGSGGDVTRQYVDDHLALKVDKVEGKGLSTNDYTNADKTKVSNSPISSTASGTSFALTDAADAPLAGLVIEGRTTLSGGIITNVGDNGTLTITSTNGTATKTAALSTGLPLCSLTGIKEEANFANGVVHKKCEKIVLNGSEGWGVVQQSSGTTSKKMWAAVSRDMLAVSNSAPAHMICDKFNIVSANDLYNDRAYGIGQESINENGHISLRVENISTAEALKTYLASNPVTVVYELAEPYDVPMTASEVAAYHNLRTFENTTNITCTDSPQMTIGYLLNTNNGKVVGQLMHTFSEMVLFETDLDTGTQITLNATITLSQAFTNFDEIIIEWGFTQNNYYEVFSNSWRASYWSQVKEYQANNPNKTVEINMNYYNGNVYTCFIPTADDKLYITAIGGGVSRYITKIIGRKYSAA